MFGFWSSVNHTRSKSSFEQWLFFIGLAIGLLSKGPIALVLTGMPIAAWIVLSGKYRESWQALPWIRGSLLTLAISLPWYVMAEMKTPGFAEYFIIGEHFKRFVVSGWEGDLYGSAHHRPKGSIWLMLLAGGLPWTLIMPAFFAYLWHKGVLVKSSIESREWRIYLMLWALMPAAFFTFAGNILWTYVLPGFPALALWVVNWLDRQHGVSEAGRVKLLVGGAATTTLLALAVVIILPMAGLSDQDSAKSLVELFQQQQVNDEPLLYLGARRFSLDFYSRGNAERYDDLDKLAARVLSAPVFVAIENDEARALTRETRSVLTAVGTKGDYTLFHSSPPARGRQ